MEAKFLQLGAVEEHSTMKKPEARETRPFILYGGLLWKKQLGSEVTQIYGCHWAISSLNSFSTLEEEETTMFTQL